MFFNSFIIVYIYIYIYNHFIIISHSYDFIWFFLIRFFLSFIIILSIFLLFIHLLCFYILYFVLIFPAYAFSLLFNLMLVGYFVCMNRDRLGGMFMETQGLWMLLWSSFGIIVHVEFVLVRRSLNIETTQLRLFNKLCYFLPSSLRLLSAFLGQLLDWQKTVKHSFWIDSSAD